MLYRFAQQDLLNWFHSFNRKPLILRGARQVGKSTLVQQFCLENQLQLFEINIEEHPLKSLEREGYPLDEVIQEIEFRAKRKIDAKNSLIFFDEIQEQPKALNLLRYFFEKKKDISVMAAGSLLEVVLKQDKIEIPVGRVSFYQLGPMTFTEFLLAMNENELAQQLDLRSKKEMQPLAPFLHKELINKLREFFIVGGMPEAVWVYKETKDFREVQKVQSQLLETYRNDFYKYATQSRIPKLNKVFDFVPTHLGKKVKYVEISRDHKAKDLLAAIQILTDARIITSVNFTKGNKIPLSAESDDSLFKLYYLDIGLCSNFHKISLETFDHENFSHFLKGELAEQFVFQHLHYGHGKFENNQLYYWLNEKKNAEAEIDFMLEIDHRLVPIEVKSSSSKKLKSLIYFMHLQQLNHACKISTDPFNQEKLQAKLFDGEKNVVVEFELIQIPLYWSEQIETIYSLSVH